jgi:hypothetical protein
MVNINGILAYVAEFEHIGLHVPEQAKGVAARFAE